MLNNYMPKKALVWKEAASSFRKPKESINNCTQLLFHNDDNPIYLLIDASDYGIGKNLFQDVDGVEKPIAFIVFISKSI